MTPAEKRLWWHLRKRVPLEGTYFRRQVPLGSYVVDFCCLKHRLVVEVDGPSHSFDAQQSRDAERDAALGRQGFRVLRFTNHTVLTDMDAVMGTIHAHLSEIAPAHA